MVGPSLDEMNAAGGGSADLFAVQNQAVQYLGLIYQALLDGPPAWVTVPATSTDAGVAGSVAYDDNYLYLCYATNRWKRIALSAF